MLMSRNVFVSSSIALIFSGSSVSASAVDGSLLLLPLLVEAGRQITASSSSDDVARDTALHFLPLTCLLSGTFSTGGFGAAFAFLLVVGRFSVASDFSLGLAWLLTSESLSSLNSTCIKIKRKTFYIEMNNLYIPQTTSCVLRSDTNRKTGFLCAFGGSGHR